MTLDTKPPLRALLLENIHPDATARLTKAGYAVETRKAALSEDELIAALPGVSLLGIRSRTNVTGRALAAAPDLLAVGAFCIGVNQIDLAAASQRGVAVFNAPFSNTRSVVELVIAEIVSLARRLPEKNAQDAPGRVGQVRGRRATRSAAAGWASSATATSARSCPCWPRTWACRCTSTTSPTSWRSATRAAAAPSPSCSSPGDRDPARGRAAGQPRAVRGGRVRARCSRGAFS